MVLRIAMSPSLGTLPEWPNVEEDNRSCSPGEDVSRQRASVKWLLSKAYNNRVPENLREPFYRDHENQEHLKPPIIGHLANAELYCLALSNMYSDPNYHNLNHWNILQTLARKGLHVANPSDCQLTETVLIQTNPLRMSAHMAVIESLMFLYCREVGTKERVSAAVTRWGGLPSITSSGHIPLHEEALLSWVSSACEALRHQPQENDGSIIPSLPKVECLRDLCDGVALAALISLYCPDVLPVSQIRAPRLASVHDSIHNLTLVYNFCQRHLPYNVFHMTPEDITYMRGSMNQNLLVMLADLFNVLEIHPAKCVRFPGGHCELEGAGQSNIHGIQHKRSLPQTSSTPIPDLRSGLHTPPPNQQPFTVTRSPSATHMKGRSSQINTGMQGGSQRSACSTPERRSASPQQSPYGHQEESFVVHRAKALPTLSSVVRQNDASGESVAAGRPSNWEEQRRSSYAGRRSRRGSITSADDSQLTVENFGGSQDHLNFVGKNPEKELATIGSHITSPRKISAPSAPIEHNVAVRSSLQDARGSIELFYHDGGPNYPQISKRNEDFREKQLERQFSKPEDVERVIDQHFAPIKRQLSSDVITFRQNSFGSNQDDGFYINNMMKDSVDGDLSTKMSSFADLSRGKSNGEQSGIQLVYMQHGREGSSSPQGNNKVGRYTPNMNEKKMQNVTTWQQQSMQNETPHSNGNGHQQINNGNVMAAQLNNIRLKLEEKRRRIEHEKRRMELALNRQMQQVGHQAFLQAVNKSKGSSNKSGSGKSGGSCSAVKEEESKDSSPVSGDSHMSQAKAERPVSLQDISTEARTVENKWLDQDGLPFVETRRTPDLDGMALEDYHRSIAKMNSSLQDIQIDINRLVSQQNQIQSNQYLQQESQPIHNLQSLHNPFSSQHNVNTASYGLQHNFGSSPHIPHELQELSSSPRGHPQLDSSQFYLHERPQQTQNVQPTRKTWAQQAQINPLESHDHRVWQSPPSNTQYQNPIPQQSDVSSQRGWATPPQNVQEQKTTWNAQQAFTLHDQNQHYTMPNNSHNRFNNSVDYNNQNSNYSHSNVNQSPHLAVQSLFNQQSSASSSPQHRAKTPQPQVQQNDYQQGSVSLQQLSNVMHTPVKAPSVDDMEPQNISFIGNADDEALQQGIGRLNITSGNRTYRLPSPTRPSLSRNSFQQPSYESNSSGGVAVSSLEQNEPGAEKGFYISFDSEQPKRPKPPLRMKRGSPKKERSQSQNQSPERDIKDISNDIDWSDRSRQPIQEPLVKQVHHGVDHPPPVIHRESQLQRIIQDEKKDTPKAIIIGSEAPPPETAEEMEKKKERIMMLSMQRRQAAEEARARSEAAAEARRQREAALADQKAARKEYQAQRRDTILQQYKLKKAMEEAEREGKVFDKSEFMAAMKPMPPISQNAAPNGPKMRPKAGGGMGTRARPKTIHIDSGAVQTAEGMLLASRGKQGSSTNLTVGYNQTPSSTQSTMRRDYYRGSQDSLADRAGLYRDSPIDDSRVMSPGNGPNALGRRGSYKTSRENLNTAEPQTQTRGRSKYSTYQNNFKAGRKSSSLMNLCDSGLGRATPPRRAPSPGMRTLPSPSGPGSLPPGLINKRRNFDDGSSDISSTASIDYSGPRLYKQPATKSNRGIMLNAVEYCVFPGAVNKEAKRRVLEEINRSESKHFLVLFRDAGCQFRALYSYCPDRDEVYKLYGTGPRQVNDRMFDKFFKYNSGSKCFSQVHTKHLTVTIDAFTIHNSLWQGKKVQLPSKKDMALVI